MRENSMLSHSLDPMKPLLVIDAILLALLIFPSYGFDHPSSQGLDFEHLLIVLVFFCITSLVTLVVAIKKKHHKTTKKN